MPSQGRDVMLRFVRAMNDMDLAALEELIAPDFAGEYPQSRERFNGFAAFRAQLEQYPGGLQVASLNPDEAVLLGEDERWALSPGYTVLPLSGPDRYTAIVRTRYPDGSYWHVVSIVDVRDGRIVRSSTYFAPEYEAPEWRADLTERY